ncbi:MAG: histidine phosphatase family protein [Hahellaceae bacterium]|nr:histidine phosphatase family protein [Hahellaceae bacterium]MCP5212328.1 histidine phosphatase family protein [Hahellaceae bacterium]
MGSIYLIRHGQASFGKADYDELSKKGHQQAEVLGEHFRKCFLNSGKQPDRFVSGALKRHRQTAAGCLKALGFNSESEAPRLIEMSGFDEFNHLEVLHRWRPQWEDRTTMAAELARHPVPHKAFQEAFIAAVDRWISGAFDSDYAEPWQAFQQRVEAAFDELIATAGESKKTLVFTSGGPIAVIVGKVLGLDIKGIFAVNENLANAGVTRVLYSAGKVSLSYLNNYSYLESLERGLLTYR